MEEKTYPWILERPRINLIKMGDQDVLITTYIGTWQRNVKGVTTQRP